MLTLNFLLNVNLRKFYGRTARQHNTRPVSCGMFRRVERFFNFFEFCFAIVRKTCGPEEKTMAAKF
jgi:hypothetical protein